MLLHQVNQKLPQEAACPAEWVEWAACPAEWVEWAVCPEWTWINFSSIFFFLIIDEYWLTTIIRKKDNENLSNIK
jgi:hypothetical protein